MLITALTKLSLLDFPGRLACIIFTGGCNLRCGYCHNAEFVLPERVRELGRGLPFETVMNFLRGRKGMLDGVVICGGEPTVQPDLLERIREIRELGLQVKLDTNGSNPAVLRKLLAAGLLDYIAMDLKDALPYRRELVGVGIDAAVIRESIDLIKSSGLEYEFRSTLWPRFHDMETLEQMGKEIAGARLWALQMGRGGKTLMENFGCDGEFRHDEVGLLAADLADYANTVIVRH